MVESKMAEFKMAAIIKLNENWVWEMNEWSFLGVQMAEFKMEPSSSWVRVSEVCKMVECKMAEFKMAESSSWVRMNEWSFFVQNGWMQMAEFKMAAIIKLSQNEWEKLFLCKMAESKMAAIIKLSENEGVWVRLN